MRVFLFFFIFITALSLIHAETITVQTGSFSIRKDADGNLIPEIKNCGFNSMEYEELLPICSTKIEGKVKSITILSKEKIEFDGNLKKAPELYRIVPGKIELFKKTIKNIPNLKNFYTEQEIFRNKKNYETILNYTPIVKENGNFYLIKSFRVKYSKNSDIYAKTKASAPANSLMLLTSSKIVAGSSEILNYIHTKQAYGFKVDLFTEKQYGGEDLKGFDKASHIRDWLMKQAGNYKYLLIIEDPSVSGNGIPMIRAYPNTNEIESDYWDTPTDWYYAEPFSDIDKDQDFVVGEPEDGTTSYDYTFVVGRIPVYKNSFTKLDNILKRTVEYIETEENYSPRKLKYLFPSAISYYEHQDGEARMPKMDGAYITEYLINNLFTEKYSVHGLVEKDGLSPSEFTQYPALNNSNIIKEWNSINPILVFWQGHGLKDSSYRTVWRRDSDNDGIPDSYPEFSSPAFINSTETKALSGAEPSFVFQGSCLNGDIDYYDNISIATLENTAIGVIGSSQISYGSIFPNYDPAYSGDIFGIGTVLVQKIVNTNLSTAEALSKIKKEMASYSSITNTIKLELNYFGDPSLKAGITTCNNDSDCDDNLFCNGTEYCNSDGFCDIKEAAPDCDSSKLEDCSTSVCSETEKKCVTETSPDGTFCGDQTDKCVERYECASGKCEQINPVDCTVYDSPCSYGTCDHDTGRCTKESINEGNSCDDENLCTENTICTEGSCSGTFIECEQTDPCLNFNCDLDEQKCIGINNANANFLPCETDDGSGYCYYGKCEIKEEKSNESSTGGCSIFIF